MEVRFFLYGELRKKTLRLRNYQLLLPVKSKN